MSWWLICIPVTVHFNVASLFCVPLRESVVCPCMRWYYRDKKKRSNKQTRATQHKITVSSKYSTRQINRTEVYNKCCIKKWWCELSVCLVNASVGNSHKPRALFFRLQQNWSLFGCRSSQIILNERRVHFSSSTNVLDCVGLFSLILLR